MIRITKLTDYAIVLLTYVARQPQGECHNSRDLALATHLPLPMVSKILKALAREGLLVSHRGVKGGYALSRSPQETAITEVIFAMEGPISITECAAGDSKCDMEFQCPIRPNWQKINDVVMRSLEGIMLSDMIASIEWPAEVEAQQSSNETEELEVEEEQEQYANA